MARPSAIRSRSQRDAVLVGEQHELAVRVGRAARRESWSSIIASSPWTSGSSGIRSTSARPEPDGLGGEVVAAAVALVEDQVEDREHGGEASGSRWSGGTRNGMPAALILRLARTSRCAMVASGHQEGAGDLGRR